MRYQEGDSTSRWERRLYGVESAYPVFEGRRYHVFQLERKAEMRLCDRCMHHRCTDTVSSRYSRCKARSWKRHRRSSHR